MAALLDLLVAANPARAGLDGRGRVVALDGAAGTITLDHSAIPGLMAASRTEFPARGLELFRGLRIGDPVRFSVEASEASHGLVIVTEVSVDPVAPTPPPGAGPLSRMPLVVVAGLWAATIIASLGALAYILRGRRQTHSDLREVTLGQAALQRDFERMTSALAEVGGALRARSESLRERLGTLHGAGSHVLVLRRGAPDPRRTLWEGRGGPEIARVVLDRRLAERRRSQDSIVPERRRDERRRPPPATWVTSGFALVALRGPAPSRAAPGSSRTR